MNGYRKYMIETESSLGWCKAIDFGSIKIAVNEGKIESILEGEIDFWTDEDIRAQLPRIARMVNPDYDLYDGYNDEHIILDAGGSEIPCCQCPWFDICDAMDNPDDWEEYHPEYKDDPED